MRTPKAAPSSTVAYDPVTGKINKTLLHKYAAPILAAMVAEQWRRGDGLGKHELLAAHAMRYALAALIESDKELRPLAVAEPVRIGGNGVRSPLREYMPPNPLVPDVPAVGAQTQPMAPAPTIPALQPPPSDFLGPRPVE